MNDMLNVSMTASGIGGFLESDVIKVTRDELEQIGRELGNRGFPVLRIPSN